MHQLLLLSAFAVGCLLAVQASVNLQLNKAIGTPYGAATVQLGVATGLLLATAAVVGAFGALGGLPAVPWWFLLGGLASPLYITSGIVLFPRLGALLTVSLFVTGQMFAGLAVDLFGLLAVRQRPLSAAIALGAVAVLAGITAITRGPHPTPAVPAAPVVPAASVPSVAPAGSVPPVAPAGSVPSAVPDWPAPGARMAAVRGGWLLLGVVAGAVLPVQGAVNARLRGALHEPVAVGLISFAVATLAIVVVLTVLLVTGRTARPRFGGLRAVPWWGWLGGACAAVYVIASFMLLPEIGAATTIALTVTGQQLASAVIDHTGAFRMARRPLTTIRLAGVALLILGSLLVQLG